MPKNDVIKKKKTKTILNFFFRVISYEEQGKNHET